MRRISGCCGALSGKPRDCRCAAAKALLTQYDRPLLRNWFGASFLRLSALECALRRAYWNGFLKLSFVSCPVALYPATTAAERVSFRQVNRRTGHRLKHKLVDSVTGETVETLDKARGYEVGEDRFLLVEDRELDQARSERPPPGTVQLAEPPRSAPATSAVRAPDPEEDDEAEEEPGREADAEEEEQEENAAPLVPRPHNTRTIEIERFVPVGQVDLRYLEKPYYVVPRDAIGQEAFAVIREAMSRENVAGLARVVLSSRERPMLVAVMGSGLCGVTLRFAHEVRKQAEYFNVIPEMKLPAEMVKLAQHIIETKSAAFDPAMLEDHYRNALVRILKKKQAKMPAPPTPVTPSRENVINLMDALRRSIAAELPAKKPAAGSEATRAKRRGVVRHR
jgi:DNA end-binding protein Ku